MILWSEFVENPVFVLFDQLAYVLSKVEKKKKNDEWHASETKNVCTCKTASNKQGNDISAQFVYQSNFMWSYPLWMQHIAYIPVSIVNFVFVVEYSFLLIISYYDHSNQHKCIRIRHCGRAKKVKNNKQRRHIFFASIVKNMILEPFLEWRTCKMSRFTSVSTPNHWT